MKSWVLLPKGTLLKSSQPSSTRTSKKSSANPICCLTFSDPFITTFSSYLLCKIAELKKSVLKKHRTHCNKFLWNSPNFEMVFSPKHNKLEKIAVVNKTMKSFHVLKRTATATNLIFHRNATPGQKIITFDIPPESRQTPVHDLVRLVAKLHWIFSKNLSSDSTRPY